MNCFEKYKPKMRRTLSSFSQMNVLARFICRPLQLEWRASRPVALRTYSPSRILSFPILRSCLLPLMQWNLSKPCHTFIQVTIKKVDLFFQLNKLAWRSIEIATVWFVSGTTPFELLQKEYNYLCRDLGVALCSHKLSCCWEAFLPVSY